MILVLNVFLLVGYLFILILNKFNYKFNFKVKFKTQLEINYYIFIVMIILSIISLTNYFKIEENIFIPTAKVWSSSSIKNFYENYNANEKNGVINLNLANKEFNLDSTILNHINLFIFGLGVSFVLFQLFKELRYLTQLKRQSVLIRKLRRVRIYASDFTEIPLSYSLTKANIIIPMNLINNISDYKISVLHEIQHHRQNDTYWSYVFLLIKIFCFLNPFYYFWINYINELQEFACDEALIGQKKVSSHNYASCLIRLAETVIGENKKTVCASGFSFSNDRKLIVRRIENMFDTNKKQNRHYKFICCTFLTIALGVSAIASKSVIQDRRITKKEALEMLSTTQKNTDFPVVVNDLVLKELNRYIGTPEGREFTKTSLQRMNQYKEMIRNKISSYRVPEEILAVPFIESGYRNLPQSQNKSWGAGLWMFIEKTARNYGLRVDLEVDERLNPEILTDAAMRYLTSNYFRFKDWNLALIAYNIGESNLQKGIDNLKTRDPWLLSRNGFQGDQYLARFMAAVLILNNQDVVLD